MSLGQFQYFRSGWSHSEFLLFSNSSLQYRNKLLQPTMAYWCHVTALTFSHSPMPYIFHIPTNFVMDISLMVYRDLCWEDKLFHWLFCSGDNKKFPPQFRFADHPLPDYPHRSIILMFWAKRLATSPSTGGNKWCRLLLHSLSSYPLICCFTGLVSFITSYM